MAAWDGYAKAGDSIKIIAVFPNTYGGFTAGLSPTVTIAMDLAGSALVSGAAMTESTALPGIYYYAYTVPASGFIYAKATSSAGDSICTWIVGTGTIPDMATATELAEVETKIDTIDGIVDTILIDTNELQTNQGNWLTATGFATATALQTVDDTVDAIKLKTDLIPADPVDISDLSGLSTFNPAVTSVTVGTNNDKTGYALTTDYDPAKTAASQLSVDTVDGLVDGLKLVSDKLDTAMEIDGAVYRFTVNALENSPVTTPSTDVNIVSVAGSAVSGIADFRATGFATASALTTIDGKIDIIDGNIDLVLADTSELQTNQGNWLTADISGISTFNPATDEVNIGKVKGTAVAGIADFRADVTGLSTFDPATDTVIVGNPNDCKADVSALETSVQAVKAKTDNLPAAPAAEPNATANTNQILTAISSITDGSTPGTGLYPLVITVVEVNTTPIGSVRVEIWNQAGTLRLASTVTDTDGVASFVLDEGTYTVRVNLVGWEFILPASVVHSAPVTALTITGSSISIGSPADSSLCRVYVWCFDQAGVEPIKTIKVSAHLVNEPVFHSGKLLSLTYYKNYYNAETGLLYWDIPRLTTVRVIIKETGFDHEVDIPDLASAFLKDLTTN